MVWLLSKHWGAICQLVSKRAKRAAKLKQYDECIDQNFDRELGYDYILKLKSNGQYCPNTDSFYNRIKREEERNGAIVGA